MSRLKDQYNKSVKNELMKKFKYTNVHQVPKIEKIIVNSVTRDAVANGKIVESITAELAAVTGQKPVVARAKKSISSFKIFLIKSFIVNKYKKGDISSPLFYLPSFTSSLSTTSLYFRPSLILFVNTSSEM